jgi:hypothetical protein
VRAEPVGFHLRRGQLKHPLGEPLVRVVADQLGIDQATLGVAKKNGVLKTMPTRRAFLSDLSNENEESWLIHSARAGG